MVGAEPPGSRNFPAIRGNGHKTGDGPTRQANEHWNADLPSATLARNIDPARKGAATKRSLAAAQSPPACHEVRGSRQAGCMNGQLPQAEFRTGQLRLREEDCPDVQSSGQRHTIMTMTEPTRSALSPCQAERPPRKRAMRTTIAAPIVEMTI